MHKESRPTIAAFISQLAAETYASINRSGIARIDPEELAARRQDAKAQVSARAALPFSESIASDRELIAEINAARSTVEGSVSKKVVLESRLTSAREHTARFPDPPRSLLSLRLGAVGVFSIAFAPTVFVLWMNTIQDAALGWLVSTLTGGAIGAFLVQVLLQPRGDGPAPKRPTLVCFGIGIGFGILRLSRAEGIEDYLVAVGLTVLECAVVAGLDWFAEKHFQSVATYRVAQAQRIALEQALDELKANLAIERSRYGGLQEQLRARESESFDVEPLAEQAAWAVEAAYRAAVHANQRCLEGGGSFALPAA